MRAHYQEWVLLATVAIFFVLPVALAGWAMILVALGVDEAPYDPRDLGSQDVDPRAKR